MTLLLEVEAEAEAGVELIVVRHLPLRTELICIETYVLSADFFKEPRMRVRSADSSSHARASSSILAAAFLVTSLTKSGLRSQWSAAGQYPRAILSCIISLLSWPSSPGP